MKQTQGRRIIAALKCKPHTYMEMLALGISVCPWKRCLESLRGEEWVSFGMRHIGGKKYLKTWRVVG